MVTAPTSHKPDIEVVQTGSQQFQLFPPDKTQKRYSFVGNTYIYDRKILLDTNSLLPLLPIRLYAGATHMSGNNALSPYIDNRSQLTGEDIDYTAAPLCLDASIHAEVLRSLKLTQHSQTLPTPLLPDIKEILSRLRFHVMLPRRDTLDLSQPIYDTFVAKPDKTALTLGELSFQQFTPQDSLSDRGYFLMFPSEDKIIQSLQGQFIMDTATTK